MQKTNYLVGVFLLIGVIFVRDTVRAVSDQNFDLDLNNIELIATAATGSEVTLPVDSRPITPDDPNDSGEIIDTNPDIMPPFFLPEGAPTAGGGGNFNGWSASENKKNDTVHDFFDLNDVYQSYDESDAIAPTSGQLILTAVDGSFAQRGNLPTLNFQRSYTGGPTFFKGGWADPAFDNINDYFASGDAFWKSRGEYYPGLANFGWGITGSSDSNWSPYSLGWGGVFESFALSNETYTRDQRQFIRYAENTAMQTLTEIVGPSSGHRVLIDAVNDRFTYIDATGETRTITRPATVAIDQKGVAYLFTNMNSLPGTEFFTGDMPSRGSYLSKIIGQDGAIIQAVYRVADAPVAFRDDEAGAVYGNRMVVDTVIDSYQREFKFTYEQTNVDLYYIRDADGTSDIHTRPNLNGEHPDYGWSDRNGIRERKRLLNGPMGDAIYLLKRIFLVGGGWEVVYNYERAPLMDRAFAGSPVRIDPETNEPLSPTDDAYYSWLPFYAGIFDDPYAGVGSNVYGIEDTTHEVDTPANFEDLVIATRFVDVPVLRSVVVNGLTKYTYDYNPRLQLNYKRTGNNQITSYQWQLTPTGVILPAGAHGPLYTDYKWMVSAREVFLRDLHILTEEFDFDGTYQDVDHTGNEYARMVIRREFPSENVRSSQTYILKEDHTYYDQPASFLPGYRVEETVNSRNGQIVDEIDYEYFRNSYFLAPARTTRIVYEENEIGAIVPVITETAILEKYETPLPDQNSAITNLRFSNYLLPVKVVKRNLINSTIDDIYTETSYAFQENSPEFDHDLYYNVSAPSRVAIWREHDNIRTDLALTDIFYHPNGRLSNIRKYYDIANGKYYTTNYTNATYNAVDKSESVRITEAGRTQTVMTKFGQLCGLASDGAGFGLWRDINQLGQIENEKTLQGSNEIGYKEFKYEDALGRVTQIKNFNPQMNYGKLELPDTEFLIYNDWENKIYKEIKGSLAQTDANVIKQEIFLDAVGNIVEIREKHPNGQWLVVDKKDINYEFNQPKRLYFPHFVNGEYASTEIYFDARGREIQRNTAGDIVNYRYFVNPENALEFQFMDTITDPLSATKSIERVGSDVFGNPRVLVEDCGVECGFHGKSLRTIYEYDARNKLRRLVSAAFDAAGQPVEQVRVFAYNDLDQMTYRELPETVNYEILDGKIIPVGAEIYHYNESTGLLERIEYSNTTRQKTFAYDDVWNRVTAITDDHIKTEYSYDDNNHPGFNAANQVRWIKTTPLDAPNGDDTIKLMGFEYDQFGREIARELKLNDASVYRITRDFDHYGEVKNLRYPDGLTVSYDRNLSRGQVTAVRIGEFLFAKDFVYSAFGVQSFNQPNINRALSLDMRADIKQQFYYDNRGRLSNFLAEKKFLGSGNTHTVLNQTFRYDSSSRIRFIDDNTPGVATNLDQIFTYDSLGRLATASSQAYANVNNSYHFDDFGNFFGVNEQEVATYYGTNNRMFSYGGQVFNYDTYGRLIGDTARRGTYFYNGNNQLLESDTIGIQNLHYYAPDNGRFATLIYRDLFAPEDQLSPHAEMLQVNASADLIKVNAESQESATNVSTIKDVVIPATSPVALLPAKLQATMRPLSANNKELLLAMGKNGAAANKYLSDYSIDFRGFGQEILTKFTPVDGVASGKMQTEYFLYNAGKLLGKIIITRDANNQVIIDRSGYEIILTDAQGSTIAAYDGLNVGTLRLYPKENDGIYQIYAPFGSDNLFRESKNYTSHAYAGHEKDTSSGDSYMLNRYYSNKYFNFFTPDPAYNFGNGSQSLNRYAYVEGDPINFIDPDGREKDNLPWVLLVEDNAGTIKLYQALVGNKCHFVVEEHGDTGEIRTLLRQNNIHGIVSDTNLPRGRGPEIFRELIQEAQAGELPALLAVLERETMVGSSDTIAAEEEWQTVSRDLGVKIQFVPKTMAPFDDVDALMRALKLDHPVVTRFIIPPPIDVKDAALIEIDLTPPQT